MKAPTTTVTAADILRFMLAGFLLGFVAAVGFIDLYGKVGHNLPQPQQRSTKSLNDQIR
jgi:hypothetical protein